MDDVEFRDRLLRFADAASDGGAGRLPSERSLSARMGVGRSALRRALAALEAEGKLMRHVGRGTFLVPPPEETVTLRLSPPPGPLDVVELRTMIEPQIAAAAALRASGPAIADLRALVRDGAAAADWQAWERADSRFHTALARASRNPLLAGVLETVTLIRGQSAWGRLRRSSLTHANQAAYSAQHATLVDAVADRDPTCAAQAMRDHLAAVHRHMVGDAPALAPLYPFGDIA